jgi:hypothetical protein
MTWASFKKEVEKLYPGSDRSAIFSLNDLDVFISTGVLKQITSKDDFAEYCRKFRTIMDHLMREGRMSELESKKMFPKGLHEDFQASIICRMEILKPAHPLGMPREIEDMIEAGQYILDAPESEVGKSADTVFIKKEMVELSNIIAKMNQRYHINMQTLTQAVNRGMQIGPPQQTYPIYQATALETVPPRPRYPTRRRNVPRAIRCERQQLSSAAGRLSTVPTVAASRRTQRGQHVPPRRMRVLLRDGSFPPQM